MQDPLHPMGQTAAGGGGDGGAVGAASFLGAPEGLFSFEVITAKSLSKRRLHIASALYKVALGIATQPPNGQALLAVVTILHWFFVSTLPPKSLCASAF